MANATFFLYSGESLFSSCFAACGPVPVDVGACFVRGDEDWDRLDENRVFCLRGDACWSEESSAEEGAADLRLRDS